MSQIRTPERALVKNAADPEQVKQAGTREKFGRERELGDLRAVMDTKEGRRLVWRLMEFGGVLTERFDENSLRMARLAGNARTGLMLLADIDAACPELFDTMRREAREESNG